MEKKVMRAVVMAGGEGTEASSKEAADRLIQEYADKIYGLIA